MRLDSLPDADTAPATDETEGGGAGLLALGMWALVAIAAALAVAAMMAAG